VLHHDALDWTDLGVVALTHPHNPTGTIWSSDALTDLIEDGARRKVPVLIDRTYAPPYCALTQGNIVLREHSSLITVMSFSKVGLAAARVGVVLASEEVVRELAGFQREMLILPPLLGQLVAVEWMDRIARRPELALELVDAWSERWAELAAPIANTPGVMMACWGGGPFLWCEWRGRSDELVAVDLLEEGIAVTPGGAIRLGGCSEVQALRIGIGAEPELLREAGLAIARSLAESV
jgi:aspartate/methionine/tyrosine aminotransferase